MVNVVLSSLTTFVMSCIKLYKRTSDEYDKYRRHWFRWRKGLEKKNPPLAAWELVCTPKDQGRLGIWNLQTQNDAMLMKNIYKFLNR